MKPADGRVAPAPPDGAGVMFGRALPLARRYADLLAGPGIDRGVIGPREVERLWERHLLNSAALAELVPPGARLLDVGSGAGMPGIPLALARSDLGVDLLEPMARRVSWLQEVVADLGLPVGVQRGRAEDRTRTGGTAGWPVVVVRALAPLGRCARLCLPMLQPDGMLLAVKGRTAAEELERERQAVHRAGGAGMEVVECGVGVVEPAATVVVVRRRRGNPPPRQAARTRRRKG